MIQWKGNSTGKNNDHQGYRTGTGKTYGGFGQPMDLDVVTDKKDTICFNCGRKGHFRSDCRLEHSKAGDDAFAKWQSGRNSRGVSQKNQRSGRDR
jgi:Zinc knuckle